MDPFVYQYVVGGLIFGVGLVYAFRQGYVGFRGRRLVNLALMLGGLAFYAVLQGFLQYAPMASADAVAYRGDFERQDVLGTGLDYAVMGVYFLAILVVGTYFGRRQKTIRDYFFGGQRFSWWVVALSMVATLIGSYSFVKYSRVAYEYGVSSSQGYLNDWFWMPLLVFGWLPIFYFSRLTSVPEYFERRFGRGVRLASTVLILVYLIGYVGVNLYTMGTALHILLDWKVFTAAALVACVSAIYVTLGGQTSVIMTDLFQGIMLLGVGLMLLVGGIAYLGGWEPFWSHLPQSFRRPFPNFNADPAFSAVGIFWQDAAANTAMFYFLNQGILMRFLAAKSVAEGRKAAVFVVLVMMPVAACVVSSGGWVARALVHAGVLPELDPKEAFFVAAEFLSRPGMFGLVVAALTAALMSTVDTLITAVAAVVVNDVYKPYVRPRADDKELLTVARISAVCVTLLGIALVPVFAGFESIYSAHGAFTAAITPPLVVTLLFSVFWRRFTRAAALWTLLGGMGAMVVSFMVPQIITPLAHGVPMGEAGPGFLGGMKQYKFMRALFGVVASGTIGLVVTWLTRPVSMERCKGLVWGTIPDAVRAYKGSQGVEGSVTRSLAVMRLRPGEPRRADAGWPTVTISAALAEALGAAEGDLLYLADRRRWLGGLHSTHVVVGDVDDADRGLHEEGAIEPRQVIVDSETAALVHPNRHRTGPIRVERLY